VLNIRINALRHFDFLQSNSNSPHAHTKTRTGIPRITKTFLDWHFVQLPFIKFGMVLLTVVPLAEQSGTGFALVQASFHDKESFARLTHGATTIPTVSFAVILIELIYTRDRRTVTAGIILPGMAFRHAVILWTGCVRGKYYYFIIFMVNCEPSFGKMNLFHIMSDP